MSGGNQQKVILARWLATNPKVLILDEPTRGIDVGAKAEIQKIVLELADEGMACLFISSELEEVLRTSHRIIVLRDKHMVAEFTDWGKAFEPAPVGFQYGYPADRPWWEEFENPPAEIGQALLANIPNTADLVWVDFAAEEIWPQDW